ncbi:MAG: flagellar biosynthetic protein FliO [Anaeromyxobacter sp.]
MIAARLHAAGPWARRLLPVLGGALALGFLALLAAAPGGSGAAAARISLLAGALTALAVLARRLRVRAGAPAPLRVLARAALSREAGVALLEVHGRPQLVGYGPGGVRVLGEVPPPPAEDAP